jgi:uncharacterized membrane protein
MGLNSAEFTTTKVEGQGLLSAKLCANKRLLAKSIFSINVIVFCELAFNYGSINIGDIPIISDPDPAKATEAKDLKGLSRTMIHEFFHA